jgi:2-phosphosulfolactate phosphatase
VDSPFSQSTYQVRFDWGAHGAAAIAAGADVVLVVDVLSFGTAVDCALAAGVEVFPFADADGLRTDADAYAASRGAVLAGERTTDAAAPAVPTLSPSSFTPEQAGLSVVLPSPNGSSLCFQLAEGGAEVVAVSLRNRRAVARWVLERQSAKEGRFIVAVVAAGERWENGDARFAVEDLLGAGSVIEALIDVGLDHCSPEAAAAGSAFGGMRQAVRHLLRASGSGRQLIERGFGRDVALATELDASTQVPVLREWSFRP